jgi:hypothetical protein
MSVVESYLNKINICTGNNLITKEPIPSGYRPKYGVHGHHADIFSNGSIYSITVTNNGIINFTTDLPIRSYHWADYRLINNDLHNYSQNAACGQDQVDAEGYMSINLTWMTSDPMPKK